MVEWGGGLERSRGVRWEGWKRGGGGGKGGSWSMERRGGFGGLESRRFGEMIGWECSMAFDDNDWISIRTI